MRLDKLSLINFKNYEEAEFSFTGNVNCFVGDNGTGKTNLLDAIYYLSFCKSFLNPIDSQNIRHGNDFFVVQGRFFKSEKKEDIYCGQKKNHKKQFKRNKKEYKRLADHIGLFPLVIIAPQDTGLIYEGSEVRRKFLDGVICQYDQQYLDYLLKYNKVLSQRNALLKQMAFSGLSDPGALEIWDVQLIEFGNRLYRARKEFLAEFMPMFRHNFEMIAEGKETVNLIYDSKLNEASFDEVLAGALHKDKILQYTTVGPHKDDLKFMIGDHPIKKYGSQGQQKSYLVALKLAQFDFIKQMKQVKPILLLDDIFDKLDIHRIKALMKLVSEAHFGQIFVTDTSKERIERIFRGIETKPDIFEVKNETVLN